MRKRILLPAMSALAIVATLLIATPAQAHGYISTPPSRQAMCAQGRVTGCGEIVYEPQSVEGPKGLKSCSGGNARFAQLDNASLPWPATSVGNSVTFNWVFTARHSTSTFDYYIGNTLIGQFSLGGAQPPATLAHTVNLGGRTGRLLVLAVWNVADTTNAFYSCVDLQVGGTTTPTSAGPTTTRPTTAPATTRPPASTRPPVTSAPVTTPAGTTTWAAGTAYKVGDVVTYAGVSYRCIQAHTALAGWEPPNVPALWQKL